MNAFKLTPFAEMMGNSSAMFLWPVFIPFDISHDLQAVGQIIAEAVEPGRHGLYDIESGVSSADPGEEHSRTPEMDPGAGKGTSLPRNDLQKSSAEDRPISIFHPFILISSFFHLSFLFS